MSVAAASTAKTDKDGLGGMTCRVSLSLADRASPASTVTSDLRIAMSFAGDGGRESGVGATGETERLKRGDAGRVGVTEVGCCGEARACNPESRRLIADFGPQGERVAVTGCSGMSMTNRVRAGGTDTDVVAGAAPSDVPTGS